MKVISKTLGFARSSSARLAVSYLAILMLLSIGFSVVLFATSSPLLQISSSTEIHESSPKGKRGGPEQMHHNGDSRSPFNLSMPQNLPPGVTTRAFESFDQQLERIRKNTIRRLIIVNGFVLIGGAILCYYLARRTLEPIERAMEAQSRFASDASHELRTPLTVIQSETEGALRMLELPERIRAVLQSNLEEIAHLKELSEDLLRLARETEALPVEPLWIDEVALRAKRATAKFAKTKNITIDVAVSHARVLADISSLTQVIGILLDNAIKYSPPKSTVYIATHRDNKQSYLYLSVRDRGIGMDSTELTHIFERFYRAEGARRQSAAGHGLGLSIAKKLVEQQRGSLTVKSKPGAGSTFTIKMPTPKK